VVAGVGMGIGGAMLASFVFEMLGPRKVMTEASREDGVTKTAVTKTAASREENLDTKVRLDTG
jgi:hypothetical protein